MTTHQTLTVEARAVCFAINDALDSQIKKLRGETNKVGFLLQYAYFKASRRFFLIKRFRQEDVEYACKLLDFKKRDVKIKKYKDSTLDIHREKILKLFNCKSYLVEKPWIEKEIVLKVQRVVEPRALFFDVLHQMHSQKDLDDWVHHYNHDRTHQGKMCCGRTPMQTFLDGKKIWQEKVINSNLN